jgi:carboxyl-terminal processing protease
MKTLRVALTLTLVAVFGAAMFAGGFAAGYLTAHGNFLPQLAGPGEPLTSGGAAVTDQSLQSTFAPFWEAWDIVHEEYVDQPVDDVKLMRGAINGMLSALGDPHTTYMTPTEYEIAVADQSGELEGIGAYVEEAGEYVRIVSPFPGSPAEAAGLRPSDLILRVDDTDIAGMDLLSVVSLVRGPAGSTVHLTVQREGFAQPLEFDVVRARILIPSVDGRMLEGGVAYVKVNDFGEKTTGQLREALRTLLAQNPTGLVLDLRNNPGGFLNTAIEVASQFVGDGLIMRERFGDGREVTYRATPGGRATQIPLVVLINQGSASASEIVAGAIQDRQRGLVVGETSYGKGSVQQWHELQGDNGAVRVTIARWLTPEGRSIHQQGITPDVVIALTEDDRQAGRDPQLDEAIRLLTSEAGLGAPFVSAPEASLP